jgi:hypothetical protein
MKNLEPIDLSLWFALSKYVARRRWVGLGFLRFGFWISALRDSFDSEIRCRGELMSQPRDDRQDDLFRPSLEKIINPRHPLVRLTVETDWDFLADRFSSVYRLGPAQPPLPTRLMAGLFILKHMHNLSDEALCDRWVENPYSSISAAKRYFFAYRTPPVQTPGKLLAHDKTRDVS